MSNHRIRFLILVALIAVDIIMTQVNIDRGQFGSAVMFGLLSVLFGALAVVEWWARFHK